MPEPWASRLVLEGGGKVLVNEKDLWPGGRVRHHAPRRAAPSSWRSTRRPSRRCSRARSRPTSDRRRPRAPREVGRQRRARQADTGKPLKPETLDAPSSKLELTDDPVAVLAARARRARLRDRPLKKADLTGIYDLSLLNALKVAGKDVDDAGLGVMT